MTLRIRIGLLVLVFISFSSATFAQDGREFHGAAPPLRAAVATMMFGEPATDNVLNWESDDIVLGKLSIQAPQITTWMLTPGPPKRLVFVANGAGARLAGDVLFGPYNRAVVDVTLGGKRVRYLLNALCARPTIGAPAPFPARGHQWSMDVELSASDGLVVKSVRLGTRGLAARMSIPYFTLDTSAGYSGRGELRPAMNFGPARSRLVGFKHVTDADRMLLEATYAIDQIPPGSNSCLMITQQYEFRRNNRPSSFGTAEPCEPSGEAIIHDRALLCSQFRPTVKYEFVGAANEKLVLIRLPERLNFRVDTSVTNAAAVFRDHDTHDLLVNPIPFDKLANQNPLQKEFTAFGIRNGLKRDDTWDNYHQTSRGHVSEPLPPPGCPECVHIHWRWGAFLKFPDGRPLIPPGSVQDLVIGASQNRSTEIDPPDWFALLNGEPIAGEDIVFWYQGIGYDQQDAFFIHPGFFGLGIEVRLIDIVPRTGGHEFRFSLRNVTGAPIAGPISLVLDNVNVPPSNATGFTAGTPPTGSPYFNVNLQGAAAMAPDTDYIVPVLFPAVPSNDPGRVRFDARVLTGPTVR